MKNKLRYVREEIGMTQEGLSKKSGISRTTISALENNEKKAASSKTLLALASALNTSVTCIFFGSYVQ